MKKKHYSFLLLGILGFLALAGCTSESVTPVETSFQDITKDSIYGQLSNFQVNGADVTGANVKPGDVMTFTVTPSKYFKIDEITNNGAKCTKVSGNDPLKPQVWSTTIVEGTNRLKGSYVVDETIDFVDEFKLEISDAVFNEVISKQKQTAGVRTDLDFRRCGIEQVGAPLKFKENSTTEKEDSGYFVNYVDGDTTHVETLNLGYTVKIRYLSIDTPESTSEIEEWGLSASNYSKFIYSSLSSNWKLPKFLFHSTYCSMDFSFISL